jgi:hypothetical protein
LVYLPVQQSPVQPLWQHVFPQSSPQQAPQQPFAAFGFIVADWAIAATAITSISERVTIERFMEFSF